MDVLDCIRLPHSVWCAVLPEQMDELNFRMDEYCMGLSAMEGIQIHLSDSGSTVCHCQPNTA